MSKSSERQTTSDESENSTLMQRLSHLSAKDSPFQRTMTQLSSLARSLESSDPGLGQAIQAVQQEVASVVDESRQAMGQLEQFKGLVRSMPGINASLDFEQAIAGIMDIAIKLSKAERAYMVLVDDASGDLRLCAARNWVREDISVEDQAFSRTVIQEAMDKAEAVLTVNASSDIRFADKQSVLAQQLRSILCLPLILDERVIGAFYLDNSSTPGVFDALSIPALSAFARQAALAIENAQQHSRVQQDLVSLQKRLQAFEQKED